MFGVSRGRVVKGIHSVYWKALVISLITAGGVTNLKCDRLSPADYSR